MSRSEKKSRRLVVDGTVFLWKVGHRHERDGGPEQNCREILAVHPLDGRGRLEIVFRPGPGRLVPDGRLHSGGVATAGAYLNLNEPGTVRALVDEAISVHGWDTDDAVPRTVDGWSVFDAVSARRPETTQEPG
ncbi:hypothetical protein OG782_03385 [Streptomyces sp. NBC_00876]|uniref:hypothetical protein n=1 Tax=Streptomyces sp. NBC_00876 TaxID=2975853 RepID=UPI003869926E|nr:hypothetical protein OG782_03385 [Streptomyces sp. NBC_00876]